MSIFKKASDCDHLVGGLTTVTIADPVPFLAEPPWFAVISHLTSLSDTFSNSFVCVLSTFVLKL